MRREELEKFLRQFEVLRGLSVEYPEGISQYMMPYIVLIKGGVNLHGEPHVFEAEIDLRYFNSLDDCMRLAKSIYKSLEKAEAQHGGTN